MRESRGDSGLAFGKANARSAHIQRHIAAVRQEKLASLRKAAQMLENKDGDEPDVLQKKVQDILPNNAELLALRFSTAEPSDNDEIVRALAAMNMLHLWEIPQVNSTTANELELASDNSDGGSGPAGAPTETKPDMEETLQVLLAATERQVKRVGKAKEALAGKLAAAEKAEAAVLQTRKAMVRAQKATADVERHARTMGKTKKELAGKLAAEKKAEDARDKAYEAILTAQNAMARVDFTLVDKEMGHVAIEN